MGNKPPTSVLTKGQREYLRGERTPAKERNVRTRIRQRLRVGVMTDIPLLLNPPAKDIRSLELEAAFDPERGEAVSQRELETALQSTVALTYRLANAAGLDAEAIIDDGVNQGRRTRVEYLYDVFQEEPERLTLGEFEQLLDADGVDSAEILKKRNRMLGLPVPDVLDDNPDDLETDISDEELDEYGTGVVDQ